MRAICLIAFATTIITAQDSGMPDSETAWYENFLETSIKSPSDVKDLLGSASSMRRDDTRNFLWRVGELFPDNPHALEALRLLSLDPESGFPRRITTLIDRTRRQADKGLLYRMLFASAFTRSAGLDLVMEHLEQHRGDALEAELLLVLGDYVDDPIDRAATARISRFLVQRFLDPDASPNRHVVWALAMRLPPDELRAMLIKALEIHDARYAAVAARQLLIEDADGAESLVAALILDAPDSRRRIGLLESVGAFAKPGFWIEVVTDLESRPWSEYGALRDVIVEQGSSRLLPLLVSRIDDVSSPKTACLAMAAAQRAGLVSRLDRLKEMAADAKLPPHIRLMAADTASVISKKEDIFRQAARRLVENKSSAEIVESLESLRDLALRSDQAHDVVVTALRGASSRDWSVVAELVRCLGSMARPDDVAFLKPLADHERWQVRLAVIEALGASRCREALPILAELTADEHTRLGREAGKALRVMTGRDVGVATENWRSIIASLPPDWQPIPLIESVDPEIDEYGPQFYGLALNSNRVVFVVDLSGSMSGTKLEILKEQMSGAIKGFEVPGGFNVVTFAELSHAFWNRLARCTQAVKTEALSRVRTLYAKGGTNLWDGLSRALDEDDADTICVLTDGQPSAGTITAPQAILEATRRVNRSRRMIIHTIWVEQSMRTDTVVIGGGQGSSFLEELARGNDGRYLIAPAPSR